MNTWNNLLAALDAAIGFPSRQNATVKKLKEGYDNKRNEHVIWLEYRVRVNPGERKPLPQRPNSLPDAITS